LIGYLRAFKPGIKYEGSSLGRIVTEINSRGLGVGKEITKEGVNFLGKKYSDSEIIISAQHRLKSFYTDLGFTLRGEVYLEDDIDHIQMYFIPTLIVANSLLEISQITLQLLSIQIASLKQRCL